MKNARDIAEQYADLILAEVMCRDRVVVTLEVAFESARAEGRLDAERDVPCACVISEDGETVLKRCFTHARELKAVRAEAFEEAAAICLKLMSDCSKNGAHQSAVAFGEAHDRIIARAKEETK